MVRAGGGAAAAAAGRWALPNAASMASRSVPTRAALVEVPRASSSTYPAPSSIRMDPSRQPQANIDVRHSRSESQRYASIQRFFVRQSLQIAGERRSLWDARLDSQQSCLHTSSRALDERNSDRNSSANASNGRTGESSSSQDGSESGPRKPGNHQWSNGAHQASRRPSDTFENYPKSLRELAMRAVAHRSSLSSQQSAKQAKDEVSDSSALGHPSQEQQQQQHQQQQQLHMRRLTKEDLLRSARGFWTRLRIRFKWFTIRGFRRFNADDFSAFFTLGGLGTVALVVVGTTTAVSILLWALDMLNMQKWIARKIADYLTAQTGVTVVFESAIVPNWKDSRICFQNVFLTRRANAKDPESLRLERQAKHRQRLRQERLRERSHRGTASTAGMGMAWEGISMDENVDDEQVAPPLSSSATGQDLSEEEKEFVNTNFTMFDLNVDTIDVRLSIRRWFDGKGLIEDAVVNGVRGIIDRRNVHWDPDKVYDPRAARRQPKPGDFEIESLEVRDVLVTIYQPSNFRPFNLSVFNASVPKLRKQWLFYDLLSAESITGQVDGCLFSLHKPQIIGRTTARERQLSQESGRWRTISRLRVDGVNVDHIQNQSGLGGPLSWILSGRFDVVADIRFPRDSAEDVDINTIIAEIVENLAHAVSGNESTPQSVNGRGGSQYPNEMQSSGGRGSDRIDRDRSQPIPGQHKLNEPAIEAPLTTVGPAAEKAWKESVRATKLHNGDFEEGGFNLSDEAAAAVVRQEAARRRRKRLSLRGSIRDLDVAEEVNDDFTGSEEARHQGDEAAAASPPPSPAASNPAPVESPPPPSVIIDLDVRFKDIKAVVPLFDSSLSYGRQAFVRPIVAFMNANRTLIPIHARVVMDLSEFDGSMDLAQTGLLPLISGKVYEAMAMHVGERGRNSKRVTQVGMWSLKKTLQATLRLVKQLRDTMSAGKSGIAVVQWTHASAAEGDGISDDDGEGDGAQGAKQIDDESNQSTPVSSA